MDIEFSTLSANLLEWPNDHTDTLGHDNLGMNDLTVSELLENYEDARDEYYPEENVPASLFNQGKFNTL